ncbi:type I phosphomannose isomerase catalytic subunit [Psychroserpens sp. Hel_I_66]|uniref:type I phosphomannose isomerase catalytic subunit n=1 Tax=Psychroserpens sp. Hel_I_66 TaxID=1250004 RepID=UPI0006486BF6|nr:type I phosphomannose isomerase catalytic subunit [Psychroserpens sp. Hel_I_66]
MKVYPIKFEPILKQKIWGGDKLRSVLSKKTNKNNIGESWEISDVNGNISQVSNGLYKGLNIKELIKNHESEFLGTNNFQNFGFDFPLLIKFLDAKTDLSVQVHPGDDMAKVYHNSFGKTEMWYIMDSDEDANIVLGLKDKNTNPEILDHITSKNVESIFNRENVKKGDSYFIPAGKIHAIGAGVLAAEIQQTSDITYRVYDWDRKDDQGQKRELHTQLAKKATQRFESNGKAEYQLKYNESSSLVNCDYFTTNVLNVNDAFVKNYANLDSFVIFMCVEGSATITAGGTSETINMGETILLPAATNDILFSSNNAKLLEVYVDGELSEKLKNVS